MKKGRKIVACLLAGLMTLTGGCGMAEKVMEVRPEAASPFNGGVFEGWGTSLCWWANRIGYSDTLSRLAAEAFCSREKGLGLNILRYNIGGGDDPSHDHITRTDSMMPGFWASPARDGDTGAYTWTYDWTQDSAQRRVLRRCLEAYGDGMLVEAFSNSPPYFMTVSGCSSGARLPFQNNIREDAYGAFADYLADVAAHFAREEGIVFQSLSPMNEPNTSYWGAGSPKQEGCHVDPGQAQSRLLTETARALAERGLEGILLAGTDETSIDTQALSLSQLSGEALQAISRVDTHSYAGSGRDFLRRQVLARGKNLWMSEVDGGDTLGKDAGEMGAGLWLARRITEDLNGLTPSAWILWQVIDSHICEAGYLGRRDTGMVDTSGGYWGTAVADHDRERLVLTMKYYVFGQFTRYIRPGSRLIALSGDAVCAEDPREHTVTLVALNASGEADTVRFDLSAMGSAYPDGSPVRVIRTSGSMEEGEHWKELEPLSLSGGSLEAELAPYSVTTFVVEGAGT